MRVGLTGPGEKFGLHSNHWRVLSKGVMWSDLHFYQVASTVVLELDCREARVAAGRLIASQARDEGGQGWWQWKWRECTDHRYMSKAVPYWRASYPGQTRRGNRMTEGLGGGCCHLLIWRRLGEKKMLCVKCQIKSSVLDRLSKSCVLVISWEMWSGLLNVHIWSFGERPELEIDILGSRANPL